MVIVNADSIRGESPSVLSRDSMMRSEIRRDEKMVKMPHYDV